MQELYQKRRSFWQSAARLSATAGVMKVITYNGVVTLHSQDQVCIFIVLIVVLVLVVDVYNIYIYVHTIYTVGETVRQEVIPASFKRRQTGGHTGTHKAALRRAQGSDFKRCRRKAAT